MIVLVPGREEFAGSRRRRALVGRELAIRVDEVEPPAAQLAQLGMYRASLLERALLSCRTGARTAGQDQHVASSAAAIRAIGSRASGSNRSPVTSS